MSEKFEFLSTITEARMFRRLSQVKGESVKDIASRLFNHLLAIRMLYTLDKDTVVEYVKDTMTYPSFNGFRTSSNDLYNLIVLVLQQYEHADKLFNDWDIVLPELRIRRVLRSIAAGKLDEHDFNELLLIIQRRATLTGYQISLRRAVSDFEKQQPNAQIQIFKRLMLLMREEAVQSDLYMIARKAGSKHGYL